MTVWQESRLLVATILVLAAASAEARPLNLLNSMRDTPITRFSSADVDLMTRTVHQALDNGADGAVVTWENARGTSGGSVTPGKDPQGRATCRVARIENRHRSLENAGSYLFCRSKGQPQGNWQAIELLPR